MWWLVEDVETLVGAVEKAQGHAIGEVLKEGINGLYRYVADPKCNAGVAYHLLKWAVCGAASSGMILLTRNGHEVRSTEYCMPERSSCRAWGNAGRLGVILVESDRRLYRNVPLDTKYSVLLPIYQSASFSTITILVIVVTTYFLHGTELYQNDQAGLSGHRIARAGCEAGLITATLSVAAVSLSSSRLGNSNHERIHGPSSSGLSFSRTRQPSMLACLSIGKSAVYGLRKTLRYLACVPTYEYKMQLALLRELEHG